MPPPRPKGVGFTSGTVSTRPNSNTPMSERQQMALLIQMTATSSTDTPRTHVKKNELKKNETDVEENDSNEKLLGTSDDHEKYALEEINTENKKDLTSDYALGGTATIKRNYSDIDDDELEDIGDDLKRKKKRDDSSKDIKCSANVKVVSRFEKNLKQQSTPNKGSPLTNKSNSSLYEKDQVELSKSTDAENDHDVCDELKNNESLYNGGLKVPPLKIVIPQQNCSIDTDGNVLRTGKVATCRNPALPYVVSTSNEISEKESSAEISPNEGPIKSQIIATIANIDDKNLKLMNEEKNLRVLRSSHRSGISNAERGSNNSSPQMQSSSPSPASCSNANETDSLKVSFNTLSSSPMQGNQAFEEAIINLPSPSTSSTSSSKDINTSTNVELHPRKRKIRSKNENDINVKNSITSSTNADVPNSSTGDAHPQDFPFTNGFQMYLNIRRQIEKKWKNLYPVKPRPPQGYNEYLITKKSYLLKGNNNELELDIPSTVPEKVRSIYVDQEKERHNLMLRHIVEREKLCLNVEQEIIRVHSKAARNMSGQSAPYSVCTFMKDDEVYNIQTQEQDEKDKSARSRFNGRLLLSWLQDVDDKWEKIKESMVLRHHNEAESLHAIQLMDWQSAFKKYNLCDYRFESSIDLSHVPIVHVSDDFDLLPA